MGTYCSHVAAFTVPWDKNQFGQEFFVPQTASSLSGDNYRRCPNESMYYTGMRPEHSASSVIQDRNFSSHQGFPEDAHGGHFLCDKLLSLRVFNVPGRLYLGTDMLSRGNLASGEWTLYPHIWSIFGRAEVDPFASEDNCHCPSYFSMQRDALVHDWPSAHLYASPRLPCCLRSSSGSGKSNAQSSWWLLSGGTRHGSLS